MSLRQIIKRLALKRSFTRALSTLSSSSPTSAPLGDRQEDPYSLLRQDPVEICSSIWVKAFSSPPGTTFPNLTGFLSKLDLWVLAYQRSCAHFTGTLPPRASLSPHLLHSLLSLRNAVLHARFSWNDKANPFVPAPNHLNLTSKRKLRAYIHSDQPCFQDRVVQEVLLMVLEPVFEARFSPRSHAFRPGRNAHTVIRTIRSNFAGYLWFLRGDLSGIFEDLGRDVVMGCVEKVVKDRKVLNLIKSGLGGKVVKVNAEQESVDKKFGKKKKKKAPKKKKILNANEPKPDPYWLRTFFSFAPEEAAKVPSYGHCGILSPLLVNVCLHELDCMMEEKIVEFFRPSRLDSIWKDSIDDGCHNPAWPEFVPSGGKEKTRKMDYVRYGSHFLIGIRGARDDAVGVRREIVEFSDSKFGLRLDNSKVEIEHISRGIKFLDHIICRRVIHPTLRYTSSGGKIVSEKGVGTLLSVTASLQQCISRFRQLEFVKGDRDPEPLPCNPMLYSSQAHTNSQMNKFLETMADWYRFADNRKKVVGFCAYVIRSSVAKLYAARYKLKSRARVYKIASRNLGHPLRKVSSNISVPEYEDLLRMGLVDPIEGIQFSHMSLIPSCDYTPFPRNWVPDHEQVLREYIRLQDPKVFCELHKSITREAKLPQDEISEIVWGCKTFGIQSYQSIGEKDASNSSGELVVQP